MDTCKFCGMDQNDSGGGYRDASAHKEETVAEPLPKKEFKMGPKVKSVVNYISNCVLGIVTIVVAFPGMTYLGRSVWPVFFGHSINAVKDQGVHYVCAWCTGVALVFSPLILYKLGQLGNVFGDFIKEVTKNLLKRK